MKRILSVLALVALAGCSLLNSPPANAGTVVVTWVNPTTNTDGSSIPATQGQPEALQRWRLEYGTCLAGNAFGVKAGEFVRDRAAGGPVLTTATQNLPAGLTCVRVFVQNTAGGESDASNVGTRDIPPGRPSPPTNVTVALAST